jgi:hypothetical protein
MEIVLYELWLQQQVMEIVLYELLLFHVTTALCSEQKLSDYKCNIHH